MQMESMRGRVRLWTPERERQNLGPLECCIVMDPSFAHGDWDF